MAFGATQARASYTPETEQNRGSSRADHAARIWRNGITVLLPLQQHAGLGCMVEMPTVSGKDLEN